MGKITSKVPFIRFTPYYKGTAYVEHLLQGGDWEGVQYTQRCTDWLAAQYSPVACYLTASCTQALFLAARVLNLSPDDEVIMPSFTHVATAAAFATLGVKLVFVDIDPMSLTASLPLVKRAITSRTRVIVAMHYGGIGSDMRQLRTLADQHGCALIEDNAHGLLAQQQGRLLGTFADMACCSFERQKNVQCGQGGALLVHNAAYAKRAEMLYHSGTNQVAFEQGEVAAYTWVAPSNKYALSELLAAYLLGGLEEAAAITLRRKQLWTHYYQILKARQTSDGLNIQLPPPNQEHNGHIFYIILPNYATREALRKHLLEKGIETRFHYTPLHSSAEGQQYAFVSDVASGKDHTTTCAEGLLRLPMYSGLQEEEVAHVCAAVGDFMASAR
ncbi:MAG: aminotransferase class I/II-fold pyridoxal phosphate-dependent enzyme [Gammaproteobacteria bacterium]|nr:aminotransferase class I/II-fold pyridoxal phosphate-dependent enzyme [Gammaproteobacteria bacterium]